MRTMREQLAHLRRMRRLNRTELAVRMGVRASSTICLIEIRPIPITAAEVARYMIALVIPDPEEGQALWRQVEPQLTDWPKPGPRKG